MNSFRVYTVEGHHHGYNEWWELEGLYGTITEAIDFVRDSYHVRLRITLWKDGKVHEQWEYNDGKLEEW